jgi:hypothetical protein
MRISSKHRYLALSLLSISTLSGCPIALAQSSAFTYQGKITDAGNPANGSYDMQFKLFDSTDFVTGIQVGSTITSPAVTVTSGGFTVQLDFGAGAFSGAPRFLEIGIRLAGSPDAFTVLSPRQHLTSAPYSVRSATAASADTATNATNAAQLGGITASQYVVTTDSRLSNARPPTAGSTNYVQNTNSPQAATDFNISGSGTAGGSLSASTVNATTQFNIAGSRMLSVPGTNNTFAGIGAGTANTSGLSNSFFGKSAGAANTSGQINAFFGADAGGNNTTGGANSFFGRNAGVNNTGGGQNSFFGNVAGASNTTGGANSFFGVQAGFRNTTGGNNTFIGWNADFATTSPTGNNNTLLGSDTTVNSGVSNSTAIGANATVTTSNTIVLGTASEKVVILGLGTVGGSALCRNASNQISFCSSSLRYKTGVRTFQGGLEIIDRLRPISFTWKQDGTRDLGLGAEEVERVEPLLTFRNVEGEIEGVKYNQLSAVFINAFKQQQAQIEQQRRRIQQQQTQIAKQQQTIKSIKHSQRQMNALKRLVCADHPGAEVCK